MNLNPHYSSTLHLPREAPILDMDAYDLAFDPIEELGFLPENEVDYAKFS